MEPAFDFWTVTMTVAASQGVFLALLIFLRKSSISSLLGTLILSFSLCLFFYVLFWTNYLTYFPFEIRALGGMTFLMGPLMLFYLKSGQRQLYFSPIHFLPALAFLLFFFATNTREFSSLLEIAQCIHLVVYAFIIYQSTQTYQKNSRVNIELVRWRYKLAWAFMGYCATFLGYYLLVWSGQLQLSYDYAISIASCIFIYYIGIEGFRRHDLLAQYENGKYANGLLPKSAAESILAKVKSHMNDSSSYLNSTLRLNDLSRHLGLSPHDVSQVLNEYEGKNFSDFVNEYRIEMAKKELLEWSDKKIIHIAYDCGFNNKVSFNNAFKKFTGMAPGQFRTTQQEVTVQSMS